MVRKDGATTRKERSELIAQTVMAALNNSRLLILNTTVAELAYKTGLSEAKITEYLQMLEKILPFKLDFQNNVITKTTEEEATE